MDNRTKVTSYQLIILCVFAHIIHISEAQSWPLYGTCHPCDCKIDYRASGRVKDVDCSSLSLEKIPRYLPEDLHTLDLSYNKLLPQELRRLCRFKFMQYTSIAFNGLESIPKYTFDSCRNLLYLNLTGNAFTKLETGSFDGLGNIRGIYGLETYQIDENTFNELTRMDTLEMKFNGLTLFDKLFSGLSINELKLVTSKMQTIPITLFQFGSRTLNFVDITGPEITFLSENTFQGLAVLRKIYLDFSKLVSLPERLFHNNGKTNDGSLKPQNIQEINIRNVHSLPPEIFKGLPNLEKLTLHGIRSMPTEGIFDDLLNLEYLDITESGISQPSDTWLSKLYSVRTLKLRQTGIRTLESATLSGLINLQELDLSYNILRDLNPESLQPLVHSIKKLNLHGNMITKITNDIFKKMFNLISLDVSDNKLTFIENKAFSDLRQLVFLDIHDNKMSSISDGIFDSLLNLQTLDLSTNTFNEFPVALNKLDYLLNLDLSDNRIIKFPNTFNKSFPYLEYLNLSGNPLLCDCEALVIKHFRPNLKIVGTCFFPSKYAGKHLTEVKATECFEPTTTPPHIATTTFYPLNLPSSKFMNDSTSYYTVNVHSTVVIFDSSIDSSSQSHLNDYYTSITFQSTPMSSNSTYATTMPTTIYEDISSTRLEEYTTFSGSPNVTYEPPIFKEEKEEQPFYNNFIFRVSIGTVVGALFVCGFVAVVLWRRRLKEKARYEVTPSNSVVV